MQPRPPIQAVSFDLFGTLVTVSKPEDPAEAVADELHSRDIPVPDDWQDAYTEPHVEVAEGAELPLDEHVLAALGSRLPLENIESRRKAVEAAVFAAFDAPVQTRDGAAELVETVASRMPTGLLSNCAVPGLAEHVLTRSAVDVNHFDAIVTSVGCGWRKPHPTAFETIASELGVPVDRLAHVGDDPRTDGGATDAGASSVLVSDTSLPALQACLEARWD